MDVAQTEPDSLSTISETLLVDSLLQIKKKKLSKFVSQQDLIQQQRRVFVKPA